MWRKIYMMENKEDEMHLISIIVPVYNVEKYVAGCIESVLNQTYEEWELLLLDDESLDQSIEICKQYAEKDSRIKVFCNKHVGVGKMRNKGIELSKGKYITFLDSDDKLEPDFLQKAMAKCIDNSIDIYMSGVRRIREGKEVAQGIVKNPFCLFFNNISEDWLIELLKQNYTASCCGKLIMKEKIGLTRFRENCVFGEDLIFVYELMKKNLLLLADNYIGYNYYERGGSLIRTVNKKKCEDIIKLYLYLLKTPDELKCVNDNYLLFIKKRCATDMHYTQKSILYGNCSIKNKYKMLKTLFSNEELFNIFKEDVGKTCLGRFSFWPSIMLLKYYVTSALMRKKNV